jgi:hypothetical protein
VIALKLYRTLPRPVRTRLLESMPAHRRLRLARRLTWRRHTVTWWVG